MDTSRKNRILTSTAVAIVALGVVFSVGALYAHADRVENPVCGLTAGPDDVLVDFNKFDGNKVLVAHKEKENAKTTQKAISIPAGLYRLTFISYDDHSDKPNQNQPEEQWHIQLRKGNHSFLKNTPITSDLPSNQDYLTEVVSEEFEVPSGVGHVNALHHAYPSDNPNSIQPVCALFQKIVPPAPECWLSVDPSEIEVGGEAVLSWGSSDALGGVISPDIGGVGSSGFVDVSPSETTTYTGEFSGPGGTVMCEATLVVNEPPHEEEKCRLEIHKSVDKDHTGVGDRLEYLIDFENTGDKDCTGGGVEIHDEHDPSLIFISEEHSGNVSYESYFEDNRQIVWNAHTLEPGESGWVSWVAEVKEPDSCGDFEIENQAHISSREYNAFKKWIYSNTVYTDIENSCAPDSTTLTLIKTVMNDDGGTAEVSDFELFVVSQAGDNFDMKSGEPRELEPGNYIASEFSLPGYSEGDWGG